MCLPWNLVVRMEMKQSNSSYRSGGEEFEVEEIPDSMLHYRQLTITYEIDKLSAVRK